jgi:histidinol-phosphatase (PHP family)
MNQSTSRPPDLHVHSEFSIDAEGKQLQFVDAAIRLKLPGIGFSEHMDFDPEDPSTGRFDYRGQRDSLGALIDLCEGEITVFFGAEVSYQKLREDGIREELKGKHFDYIIGSLHHIGDIQIENMPDIFREKSALAVYRSYFREYFQMVQTGLFDIAGHLDYPKELGNEIFGDFQYSDYADLIDPILEAIAGGNMALEINTAGWRSKIAEQFPSTDILSRYKSLGGEYIVFGSDAHNPAEVGADFDRAVGLAREIGLQPALFASRNLYTLPPLNGP